MNKLIGEIPNFKIHEVSNLYISYLIDKETKKRTPFIIYIECHDTWFQLYGDAGVFFIKSDDRRPYTYHPEGTTDHFIIDTDSPIPLDKDTFSLSLSDIDNGRLIILSDRNNTIHFSSYYSDHETLHIKTPAN